MIYDSCGLKSVLVFRICGDCTNEDYGVGTVNREVFTMAVGTIGQYSGLNNVHSISNITQVDTGELLRQQNEKQDVKQVENTSQNQRIPVENARLENISLGFNKSDTYDFIGRDKDTTNLDIAKAVDEMRKDQMLEQYQFFVGTRPDDMMYQSGDGVVVRK